MVEGKPVTPTSLAHLLSPYEIVPHNIRIESKVLKGYERDDFEDAWSRYLRSLPTSFSRSSGGSATGATPFVSRQVARKKKATSEAAVATQEAENATTGVACSDAAPSGPQPPKKGVVEVEI